MASAALCTVLHMYSVAIKPAVGMVCTTVQAAQPLPSLSLPKRTAQHSCPSSDIPDVRESINPSLRRGVHVRRLLLP